MFYNKDTFLCRYWYLRPFKNHVRRHIIQIKCLHKLRQAFYLQSQLPSAVLAQVNNNNNIFNLKSVSTERLFFFFFAVGSTDLKLDAVDGSDQHLGTAIAVYLEKKSIKSSRTRFIKLQNKPIRLS